MKAQDIYHKMRAIAEGHHLHSDQLIAIAKWIEEEFIYNPRNLTEEINTSENDSPMWYSSFKVGDTIRYDDNVNYKKTGEVIDFILTERFLDDIKRYYYNDVNNFHNMRVLKRMDINNT